MCLALSSSRSAACGRAPPRWPPTRWISRPTRRPTRSASGRSAGAPRSAPAILGLAIWRATGGVTPDGDAISGLGLFGAAANLVAALLLIRYRQGDANVRSVWLCTRNDLIQCLAVAATGIVVSLTHSRWPDLIVGALLAAIFLRSAWQISAQALRESKPEGRGGRGDTITHSPSAVGPV